MLVYTRRVRDLVHGTIRFTAEEYPLINHPVFQRLRNVKQNDVSSEAYPSINTSRFEHTLGVCHVAGKMAETLTQSPDWHLYESQLRQRHATFAHGARDKFVQIARFYALLHDIGHFPLSHLFEDAFKRYVFSTYPGRSFADIVYEWFGVSGFEKPHEAFGAYLATRLRHLFPSDIEPIILKLMTEKELPKTDPLIVIKKIVDADIDADRIDFVRRDGLLAGGEYGHYDVERLCTSVMLAGLPSGEWDIAFSDRSITSMEALLFDRYRVYEWVHFHPHIMAVKACVSRLIENALKSGTIRREDFTGDLEATSLKDDAWLLERMRGTPVEKGVHSLHDMYRVACFHDRSRVTTLWRRRPEFLEMRASILGSLGVQRGMEHVLKYDVTDARLYEQDMSARMGITALYMPLSFRPFSTGKIKLFNEQTRTILPETLLDVSTLVRALPDLWANDPNHFVVLVGEDIVRRMRDGAEKKKLRDEWREATAASRAVVLVNPQGVTTT